MSEEKHESVRAWYDRTTTKWRRALVLATIIALVVAAFLFALAETPFLAKLQTFNGAFTIPIAGAIWLLSFVYIFLVPNREVGFRSQEALERMEERLTSTIDEKFGPALEVWTRVGETVETHIKEGLIKEIRAGVEELRTTAAALKQASADGEQFAKDAKPAMEALKRIETRVEKEIESGIFDDAKIMIEHFKGVAMPKQSSTPDLDMALSSISKGGKR